jgi:HlyD family secretion protein
MEGGFLMRHASLPRYLPPLVLVGLVAAGLIYLTSVSNASGGPLQASGTVESDERVVAAEIAGRVVSVVADEGDTVTAGEILIRLDPATLQAQRDRADQAVAAARAAVDTAEATLAVAQIQLEMAQAGTTVQDRARLSAAWTADQPPDFGLPGWYFLPAETFEAAQSEVEQAAAQRESTRAALDRLLAQPAFAVVAAAEQRLALARSAFLAADAAYDQTVNASFGTDLLQAALDRRDEAEQELEDAQSAYDDSLESVDEDSLRQARAAAAAAEARWLQAVDDLNRLRTGDETFDSKLAQARRDQAAAARDQSQAALRLAEADLASLEVQLTKLTLSSPASGVVLARSIEPGEVLQSGAPALTIGVADSLTITVYLPEDRYGELALGDPADVTVDALPGTVFRAVVVRIADRAEYTPRNVQTDEGRRTTVFAVRLSVEDPSGQLKPGMPADVTFGAR